MSYNQRTSTRNRRGQSRSFRPNRGHSRGPRKENIHPSKFIKPAKASTNEAYEPTHSFDDFAVASELKTAIAQRQFKAPTAIQDQTIPVGLAGQDVTGIADTGTGKTVAFAVPVLNRLITDPKAKAIILAPTRELAEQILNECRTLANSRKIFWTLLIGGTPMGRQFRDLSRNPNLVIGTPGRIKDHIERKSLDLSGFNIAVLDEVDRMLDLGFLNEVRDILSKLDTSRQSYFFSATINPKVRTIIDDFGRSPKLVSVKTGDTSDNVDQNIVRYSDGADKSEKLKSLLDKNGHKILIFDDTRRQVEKLSRTLQSYGHKAESIHGGKSQGQRKRALASFKFNVINILVATDVAARGIDVNGIRYVINYSTPQSYNDYIHRIGRAGRAGNMGYAITFVEA